MKQESNSMKFTQTFKEKWISIDKELPDIQMDDWDKGYSEYTVKHDDGSISASRVYDSNIWKSIAKKEGITHWLKI